MQATEGGEAHRVKRFKHQSYSESLKAVHAPSAFNQTQYEADIGDRGSHFYEALEHWRQLNLSPSFIRFAHRASPLSKSMPLLLHHWREIIELWRVELDSADDEGLKPLLDLLQKMTHDLRTTIFPAYPDLLKWLLQLLSGSLSTAALATLLETFSVLFKFLLVPAVNLAPLESTWSHIRKVLPKCLPEIQRAMAEVWGSVLRRMKAATRERAIALLAESAGELQDPAAWAVVFACKSVAHTLHAATPSIFSPLLSFHMSCESCQATHKMLRRTVTALIHHVNDAAHLSILCDLIIQHWTSTVKITDFSVPADIERLCRTLEIVVVLCEVRKGSRLSDPQLTQLFSQLELLPTNCPRLQPVMLHFAASLLMAVQTSHWLGPGLKLLQRLWAITENRSDDEISFVLNLHGALAELGWGGWKLVAMPLLIKHTMGPELLDKAPQTTMAFLAALKRMKKLTMSDVDLVWRARIEKFALARIELWTADSGDASVAELNNLLVLAPFFSSAITSHVIAIINQTLGLPVAEDQDEASRRAQILKICMEVLSRRQISEWDSKVDLTDWTTKSIENRELASEVFESLVTLSDKSALKNGSLEYQKVYTTLQSMIMSHSRSWRLSAMRLLSSKLVNIDNGPREVLKRCLQGEEVQLDVQGVRERVLRIGRVGQVVGDGNGAELCSRWLIAQLKVNLRPLWSPAMAAIGSLGQRFGAVVWRLLITELQNVIKGYPDMRGISHWPENGQDSGTSSTEDTWESERTWRDPSAHQLRSTVLRWTQPEASDNQARQALQSIERFDIVTYEFQILSTLGECSSLVEKYNRELVPEFLALVGGDSASKLPRSKLSAWLTLFSQLKNPQSLYLSASLKDHFVSLLSHPDRGLQKLALSCVLTFKSPHLLPHKDKLHMLLDDTNWRDELTTLDFASIEPQDRPEVIRTIIRLLFGLMLERKGRSTGADRRAAVLSTLAGCTNEELSLLVDLMVVPMGSSHSYRVEQSYTVSPLGQDILDKQIIGFLTLLGDVLKTIGSRLVQYYPALLKVTIDTSNYAQSRLATTSQSEDRQKEIADDISNSPDDENEHDINPSVQVVRSIRQMGLKRLADFCRIPVPFNFSPYISAVFGTFICPRIFSLDIENTQAPSALLDLFHVWSTDSTRILYLVNYDHRVIPKIYACLIATNVKPSVISRVFDIVDQILQFSACDETIRDTVLKPHVSLLLSNLAIMVERTKCFSSVPTPLHQRQFGILSDVAQYSTDATQASTLVRLFSPLLRRPSKFVPEKVKIDLIKITGNLLPLIPDLSDRTTLTYQTTFALLSQLFQTLRSRSARVNLIETFHRFASLDPVLQTLAELLESLNAYSAKRLDEPDFDRRLKAFATLNEKLFSSLAPNDWLPIIYNMLHFIQDPDELAVRNNASFSMRHFIDIVACQSSTEFEEIFLKVLFPGIKNGLHSKNEMVRVEILGVLAYAIEKCKHLSPLQEMQVLLEHGDEEANFFNNICHVQIHRRSRALRRLSDHCDEGHLRSGTLAEIFIPLVSNYIMSTSRLDHHFVNDAIMATGRMAKHLSWGHYNAHVQRYLKLLKARDESERVYSRVLVALLDAFHFPMEVVPDDIEINEEALDDGDDIGDLGVDQDAATASVQPKSSGNTARIADSVNFRLLPKLLEHLEKHNDSTDDTMRIPIAVGIVTVAIHLPATTRESQITRLLTILCQVLRSKSQETRDLTRDALNRIAVKLGPTYLPLILRELRAALLRGPQLHVLAYVTHSLLVHVTSGEHAEKFRTLDECASDVAYVSAEVIFGQSGQDVQSEDFKTKMREVRSASSKGLDSFGVIAKYITPGKISSLLVPLRSIMRETVSVKVMQLVDDVLARVAAGLNGNSHLEPNDLLVLCHTLISQNAKFLKQTTVHRKTNAKNDVIVQVKRQAPSDTDHYTTNSFRFVVFGLDLFNTALRRNRFDFRDSQILARLASMVVVLGNTLYSTNSSVLLSGLKCAAGLMKCPLKALEKSTPVFVRQILDVIQHTGNTESDVVQTALKSLATIFRDGPGAQVAEKDLVYLLELLSPDLEEPSRQATVFSMLRAIVARKFVVPEIYDLMEKVSEMMVTSQSVSVQEHCRGILLQFLLDYPQGKGRLRKQMVFFAKNLSYVYESGRKSVMELLGAVIAKFEVALIREYTDLLFVALVLVVANDDSAKCREMAADLIKALYVGLDDERRKVILSHLHSWAAQQGTPQLSGVSLQVYGFVIDTAQADIAAYVDSILDDVQAALHCSADAISNVDDESDAASMSVESALLIPYHALTLLGKILHVFPIFAVQPRKIAWSPIVPHLLFPHARVRSMACRLLGVLFTEVPVALPNTEAESDNPLSPQGMLDVAKKLCQQLKSEHLDEALGLQITKNLFYLGKCFSLISVPTSNESAERDAEDLLDDEATGEPGQHEQIQEANKESNPLPWLFSKISYQIRSAHIARRRKAAATPNWSQQPLAALRWFAAMASHMSADRLKQFLVHILSPVYRLIDDDTIRDDQMEKLKTTAIELQDLVQGKVGVTDFSAVYNQIRQSVLGVRRERKVARITLATTNPEATAKRKLQRNIFKRESRKRKEGASLHGKNRFKRRRTE